jgi:hypothetical protein
MTVAFTHLATSGSTTDATSFTTASIAPAANRVVYCAVLGAAGSGGIAPTPTVTGLGLSWVLTRQSPDPSALRTVFWFRAVTGATAPTPGAVTIAFGSTTIVACNWTIHAAAGADPTAPTVQSVEQRLTGNTNTSINFPFSNPVTAGNAVLAAVATNVTATITPGSGWTTVGGTSTLSTPSQSLMGMYSTTALQNITSSWTGAGNTWVIGIEVPAAAAGTPATAGGSITLGGAPTVQAAATAGGSITLGGSGATSFPPITWQGHTWYPRSVSGAPGPNTWGPSQAWVDASGYLNLRISQVNGVWTCAEVDQSDGQILGYGKYEWVYDIDVATRDVQPVLGLYTYNSDPATAPHQQEIDIEVTNWGTVGEKSDLWYSQQPTGVLGTTTENRQAASTLAGAALPLTSSFTWQPGQIYWKTTDANGVLISEHVTTEGVFAPSATGPGLSMNLWLNGGNPPNNGQPVTAKIRSFNFTASATHALVPADQYVDPFDNAYGWRLSTSASIAAGELSLSCTPQYEMAQSGSVLDMRNSSTTIQTSQAPVSGGQFSQEMLYQVRADSQNYFMIFVSGGGLAARMSQGGVNSAQLSGGTYNATTHAYWRISVAGSTVTFATSPNRTTWTSIGTLTTTLTSQQLSSMREYLQCGYWGAETGSQGAWKVTQVGAPATTAPATAGGSISLGGTVTARAATTAGGGISLGGSATGTAAPVAATAGGSITLGGAVTARAPAVAAGGISLGGAAAAAGTGHGRRRHHAGRGEHRARGGHSRRWNRSQRVCAGECPGPAGGGISLGGSAPSQPVAAALGGVSLGGAVTARTAASAGGGISLGGAVSASAPVAAGGQITLGGTVVVLPPGNNAQGSITLGGSAPAVPAAAALGGITLGGTTVVLAAAVSGGTISLGGAATGQQPGSSALGGIQLGGAGTARTPAVAGGTISLGGSALARAAVAITGGITLGGLATGGATPPQSSSAAGQITLGGASTVRAPAGAGGQISLDGSALARAVAAAGGQILLSGIAAGAPTPVPATAAGGITLGGASTAWVPVMAGGEITLGGSVFVRVAASALGGITLGGGAIGLDTVDAPVPGVVVTWGPVVTGSLVGSLVDGKLVGHLTARTLTGSLED